jgi:putative transposase
MESPGQFSAEINSAMSSRSTNDRCRPDGGFAEGDNCDGGMPPASRNHLVPTGGDTPACNAASSLERPAAIADQNTRRCSRRATGGRPGECSAFRVDRAERRFPTVIATSFIWMLRRPVEPAQYTSVAFGLRCKEARIRPSMGSVGGAYDNAM